jgi:sulfate adenylyltransferase
MPEPRQKAKLIDPYGGRLVDLLAVGDERQELIETSNRLPALQISERALYDLELLAVGAFSPLDRFMGKDDYNRVLTEMRLKDGTLFPLPVTLPVDRDLLPARAEEIALCDAQDQPVAVMQIDEVYTYHPQREARLAFGTTDSSHPLVAEMAGWGKAYLSGPVRVFELPRHREFGALCLTPAQARGCLEEMGFERVVAFQTRNPMHRIHEELTKRAAEEVGGSLLIHPVVGMTRPGDTDEYTRIRVYTALVKNYYDPCRTLLSLFPLAMRLAGPREAVWHALIRRNYGATHFIIGRDHAGPGKDSRGSPIYEPYEAQIMLEQYAGEIGVEPVQFKELVYLAGEDRYEEADKVQPGAQVFSISGTQVREDYLAKGRKLPEWFTRPEVAEILQGAGPHPLILERN